MKRRNNMWRRRWRMTKMWGWCNDDVCCNVKNDVTWRTKGAVITVCGSRGLRWIILVEEEQQAFCFACLLRSMGLNRHPGISGCYNASLFLVSSDPAENRAARRVLAVWAMYGVPKHGNPSPTVTVAVWKISSTLWPHAKRVWMTAKDQIMQETSWHTNRRYTNKKKRLGLWKNVKTFSSLL